MKLFAAAVATGLALAAGVLGLRIDDVGSATSLHRSTEESGATVPRGMQPQTHKIRTAGSHSDANTEGTAVYLNQKVIDGEPTVLCTEDPDILPYLREAVTLWNEALSGALPFAADGGPFEIYPKTGGAPGSCDDKKPSVDVDVEIVYERSSKNSVYDSKKSDVGEPPRKDFETDNEVSYKNTQHATIVLRHPTRVQFTPVQLSTLVHELGHVLGLSDYKSCTDLRSQGSVAVSNPDPSGQHFSLMAKRGAACRPPHEKLITGRDLRDLYEAYHVGAVTNINLNGNVTVGPGLLEGISVDNLVEFSLRWGMNGIEEASHGASLIVVLRRDTSSGPWHVIHQQSIRDSMGNAREFVNIEDPSGKIGVMYKVVGVTRGDIRWEGNRIETSTNASTWVFDRELLLGSTAYTEGDPAFVVGVELYKAQSGIDAPEILSASLSPRYCWSGDSLAASVTVSGGATPREEWLKGPGETQYDDSDLSAPCGTTTGKRSFSAKGEWGGGGTNIVSSSSVDLPVAVHAQASNNLALGTKAPQPTTCASKKLFLVGWEISGGTGEKQVWIGGMLDANGTSPASVKCQASGTYELTGFALDEEGRGAKWSKPSIMVIPEALTGMHIANVTPTSASIAGLAPIVIGQDATALSYYYEVRKDEVTVLREGSVFPLQVRDTSYTFTGLTPSTTYKLGARLVTNEANTDWLDKTTTTLKVPQPTGLSATATAKTATLSWSAVTGATGYQVKRGASGTVGEKHAEARSHTFTGLSRRQSYTLYVRALIGAAESDWASAAAQTTAAGAAPSGLTVEAGATKARFSWKASPDGDGYRVYWCGSGSCAESVPVSGSSHVFTGLSAGGSYTFYVGLDAGGLKSPFVSVEATMLAAGSDWPERLRATPTAGGAQLSWDTVAGATGYEIRACAGEECVEETAAGASHTLSGLGSQTRYTFTVRARGTGPWSPWSAEVTATTLRLRAPARPSGLAVSAVTARGATLSWTASERATSYEVRACIGVNCGAAETVSETSYAFTELTPRTRYRLQVRALNGGGASNWVGARATTLRLRPPPLPKGLAVGGLTATGATLSWNAAERATSYDARACVIGGSCGATQTVSGTSYAFTDLTPSTRYRLQVRAQNADGASNWAGLRATTPRATVAKPPVPTGLAVSAITATGATLSWEAADRATSYDVRSCIGTACGSSTEVTTTSHPFGNLTANTEYSLEVRARNAGGVSGWASIDATTLGLTVAKPPVPTGLAVSGITASGATLTWGAADRATSYDIRSCIDSTCGSSTKVTTTSYEFTNLTANTEYSLEVRARNAGGVSGWASIDATTLRLTDVPPPTGVQVSAVTVDSATLSWITAAGYSYEVWREGDTTRRAVAAGGSSHLFSGLDANTSYELYVAAKQGTRTSTSSSAAALTLPAKPSGLSVDEITASGMRLNWTAVTGLSYEVALDAGAWEDAASDGAHTFADLTAAQRYTLKVQAANASGDSASASIMETTLSLAAVPAPTGVEVSAVTVGSATLSWEKADETSYEVWREGDTTRRDVAASESSYTFPSLSANTSYKLYVVAQQDSRESTSASATALTLPAKPSGLSVDAITASSLRLNWTAVSGLSYEVALDTGAWEDAASAGAHRFTNLNAAQTYTLKVRASNASGDSAPASTRGTTKAAPTCALPKPATAQSVVVDTETQQVTRNNFRYTEERKKLQAQTRSVTCGSGGHWVKGAWVNLGAATWGAWVVISGPNCPITKQPQPDTSQTVDRANTRWVTDGKLEREEQQSYQQLQTRTVSWVGVPTCAWGTPGPWQDAGGPINFGSWTRTGSVRCKGPQPAKPDTGRVVKTTEKRWQLVDMTAYEQSRTKSQPQQRSVTWSGPEECGWSEGAWTDDGLPTYTAWTNTGTSLSKPASRTWAVKTQLTFPTRWVPVNDGLFCIEYEEKRQRFKRKYYQRTYAWSGTSWVGTTKHVFTDPTWSYTSWNRTSKSRACPQGADQTAPPSARLAAGDYRFQWGSKWLEFTVPDGKSVVLSFSAASADATLTFQAAGGTEQLAITAALFAADGSLSSEPTLSDTTLKAIKDSLRLRDAPPAGASAAEAETEEADCAVAVWPETGPATLDLDANLCAVASGGELSLSYDGRTLSLSLTAGRDWLVARAPTEDEAGSDAIWLVDLASGSALALNPLTGAEVARALSEDAPSEMGAWFDELVRSATVKSGT